MANRSVSIPAFGHADLSNCEREQIHLAASIQPHGALLVIDERTRIIVQASENTAKFLGLRGGVLGVPVEELGGDLLSCVQPHLAEPLDAIPRAVRCRVGRPMRSYDCLVHRPGPGSLVIEFERAGETVELPRRIDLATQRILTTSSTSALCDETARLFKELTAYDRVMVYRFDENGHGEVFAEQRETRLEAFLGNRYPASDIPQIARLLYIRNRVRVLVDVDYQPVPLLPRLNPISASELDMSLCFLRSMSPIHIQYLKNMGVCATLVISIVVNGKLWGLIACHHYSPKFLHFEMRAMCELLAEVIGTRIVALESFARAQAELSVRRLEQRMIDAIMRDGDWRGALFDSAQTVLSPARAQGAALLFEGDVFTVGEVPGTQQLRELGAWLDRQPRQPLRATASLGIDEPSFSEIMSVASGMLAVAVSNTPGEYLIWFRPEQVRTVTWGGNPTKPMIIGDSPAELSPRRSFAQWHQIVEGTSEPWTSADLAAARLIAETLNDVVLQFRAVRVLIARDQLDAVSRQVSMSDQPAIVTDAGGTVLIANDSSVHLIGEGVKSMRGLEGLAHFLQGPTDIGRQLRSMVHEKKTWRGEAKVQSPEGRTIPILVRGDPVYSAPGRVLGFVLLFIDLTERKAAEAARQKFQDVLIERHHLSAVRLDSKADIVFQNLLASIVENAQLAALEISDSDDPALMPQMLDSVRGSVARSAEVLRQLVWHASKSGDKPPGEG